MIGSLLVTRQRASDSLAGSLRHGFEFIEPAPCPGGNGHLFRKSEANMDLIDRKIYIATAALLLLAFAAPRTASAQQRYPIETRSEWQLEGRYTKEHIIDVGDVPGHQIRILELYRTYNDKEPICSIRGKSQGKHFLGFHGLYQWDRPGSGLWGMDTPRRRQSIP